MSLSKPIFHLKRDARRLSREQSIPLHAALDRVAAGEGIKGWSLLASRHAARSPARALYDQLNHGELLLIGARPGHGKTLMGLALAAEAVKAGHEGIFFTLEYTESNITDRLAAIGFDPAPFAGRFSWDCSDAICAGYVIEKLGQAAPGTVVVIDYLQLLDQRRTNPPIADQVASLHAFAQKTGVIIAFIAQIDRSYEAGGVTVPSWGDIRLPNPLDMSLFSRACFLNRDGGQIEVPA